MLAKIPKVVDGKADAIFNAIAEEEWSRWRLIMAEDCSITHTEAFDRMSDLDVAVANAALNKAIKQKKRASNSKN